MESDNVITPRVVKEGLSSPQGLAVAGGHLYVVEAGTGRLLAINLSGGDTRPVATGMSFSTGKLDMADTRNWARSSILISGKTAYIGGAGSGNVYKIGI